MFKSIRKTVAVAATALTLGDVTTVQPGVGHAV
jgi:hypothetical protein